MNECCDMRGFLSFTVLRLIAKKNMSGEDLREELKKRKGTKPSPGTIYPALKELKEKGLIKSEAGKYSLTLKGKKALNDSLNDFFEMFCDLDEMKKCCGKR